MDRGIDRSELGFEASMFMRGLRFLEFDAECWVLEEPGDVNLIRRMSKAGVRFASTEETVPIYYPSTLQETSS